MSRQLPRATARRLATDGPTYVGQLPEPWSCVHVLIESEPICTIDQWIDLGRPLLVVRYALGRRGDIYGTTYSSTYLSPYARIAARAITPQNCVGIELGIVTDAGDVWSPASITRESDEGAARDYVRRVHGMDQPMYYWDHSLAMEQSARYLAPDGRAVREPQHQPGQKLPSPGTVIGRPGDPSIDRLVDDGGIVADGDGEGE